MNATLVLLVQAIVYFSTMAALFRLRHRLGIGVIICALGVMHFLETYLAAVFFIQLPFGLISPGSTVLFSGKLAIILLLYIREDAETVRQPIYGLLIGNLMITLLVFILRYVGPSVALPGYNPDLVLIDQIGYLMVWGTLLLFIDSILLILLFEWLRQKVLENTFLRVFASLVLVLTFDQLIFYMGLHQITNVPTTALFGGWAAKIGAAAAYSLMAMAYLTFVRDDFASPAGYGSLISIFDKLTYRHRYENLLREAAIDQVTGALNRKEFEDIAHSSLARALQSDTAVSFTLVDIDHFKAINDRYGHVTGDEVLRQVATVLRKAVRKADRVFRYGGEEFVIVCEGLPHDTAIAHAERLRTAVSAMTSSLLATPLTISAGVATSPGDGRDVMSLIREADARLYQAKREGRDRVIG